MFTIVLPGANQYLLSVRRIFVSALFLLVVSGIFAVCVFYRLPTPIPSPRSGQSLAFVSNVGQSSDRIKFQAHGRGQTLFFSAAEISYSWLAQLGRSERMIENLPVFPETKVVTWRQQFIGANESAEFAAADLLPGKVNYWLGNDIAKWQTNLSTYGTLSVSQLYPGIDVSYQGQSETLGMLLVAQPGASIEQVQWRYLDVTEARVTVTGQVQLTIPNSEEVLIIDTPVAWQLLNGQRISVATQLAQQEDGTIKLKVNEFDPFLPLNLTIFTPLSMNAFDWIEDVDVDANGHVYVTGVTTATDFPVVNPIQTNQAGDYDAFVTQFSADGSTLLYSTFLGGTGHDMGTSIRVDDAGTVYLLGFTESQDFPTWNPLQANLQGSSDLFVAKLQPDGSLPVYSTYLGGSAGESPEKIEHDGVGNAYVTGNTESLDFPMMNPLQAMSAGQRDVSISKISADGQSLLYSTYLGGTQADWVSSLAIDVQGSMYLTGMTSSDDFPLSSPIQATHHGAGDSFISRLTADGQTLTYSTYLGGSYVDYATDLTLHLDGSVSVVGTTYSADFPVLNPLQAEHQGGGADFFVTHISQPGTSLLYSTYLGGSSGSDTGMGIEVDGDGNYYIVGISTATDFPMMNPIQGTYGGGFQDVVVAKIDNMGTNLSYSTYLGGSGTEYVLAMAIDSDANTYLVGGTDSLDFPTTPGAWQTSYSGGGDDGFVTKLSANGSAFGYSTYLGGGIPTDVTITTIDGTRAISARLIGLLGGILGLLVLVSLVRWRHSLMLLA